MTQEKLNEANSLSKEIDKLKGLCQFMNGVIAKYNFKPPTRISGFYLYYDNRCEYTLNEEDAECVYNAFKARIKELTDKFDSI